MKSRITRRHALKTTGALLMAGALPAQEPKKPKRVVVIGGGIGGLSCASANCVASQIHAL